MSFLGKILISGSSGFVGSFLSSYLKEEGYFVQALPRHIYMEGRTDEDVSFLEGYDAVIHLAGESLSTGFWTKGKKQRILKSRVEGTQNLTALLGRLQRPPRVFISASAVGYYGDRQEELTEDSNPGSGFLSLVCQEWEFAARSLEKVGVRVVLARFGCILSPKGGMLKAILPIFRMGLGGVVGGGAQYVSWIALEDVARSLGHILKESRLRGPVNVVSPHPVTQKYFAKTLAHILRRPCVLPIPAWMLFGEKAKALALPSLRVLPVKLQETGFIFLFPKLKEAFQVCLLNKNSNG